MGAPLEARPSYSALKSQGHERSVVSPERMRKIHVLREMELSETGVLETATISHELVSTTEVRMAVAKLELIPSTPTLSMMEVTPANRAETKDQRSLFFT